MKVEMMASKLVEESVAKRDNLKADSMVAVLVEMMAG